TICLQPVISEEILQGNYPSIPILNNMIIDLIPSEDFTNPLTTTIESKRLYYGRYPIGQKGKR
ncbi:22666_t:CDS:2, partial [Gigaspora rosea]